MVFEKKEIHLFHTRNNTTLTTNTPHPPPTPTLIFKSSLMHVLVIVYLDAFFLRRGLEGGVKGGGILTT